MGFEMASRDHRPYIIKKAYVKFQRFYTNRFLQPQFESLGDHSIIIKPWYVEIFGPAIELGKYAHVIAAPDMRIRLSAWSSFESKGAIRIGDYCLISPGVRISAGRSVDIGDSCMLASKVYITDSDWHGVYNRVSQGLSLPVRIHHNVWIGDSTIICKGVSIGENSIIGAGSVVTRDIPPDAIAAGNPAVVVKQLDSDTHMTARKDWFSDPDQLRREFEIMDRELLKGNTLFHWLRYLAHPRKGE